MADKRKFLRLPVESRIFIELESPLVGRAGTGRLAACKTLNISRGGLQVSLAEPVPVGAILQICVELPDSGRPLYLAGEVRWCRPGEAQPEREYTAGFQLLNAGNSDIDRWVELIAGMEE